MTTLTFSPPAVLPDQLLPALSEQGYAVLDARGVAQWLGTPAAEQLPELNAHWNDLPMDQHLKDGGRYRSRRHGSCVVDGQHVQAVPDRPHWQPLAYNALHGGMQRWFAPLPPGLMEHAAFRALLVALGEVTSALRGKQPWYVESHLFRIDTADGIGRPTPEGAHRDGVDLVAVFLVARHHIKGGETMVFDAQQPHGLRFTLAEPWSLLLLDDQRVIHESTPIQPLDAQEPGWRDTLVITLRSGGFLEDTNP